MAMIKCKECGGALSNKASTCPQCGAKVPKRTGLFTWLVTICAAVAVVQCVRDTADQNTRTEARVAREASQAAAGAAALAAVAPAEQAAASAAAAAQKLEARREYEADERALAFLRAVKQAAHDPESVEFVALGRTVAGALCLTFRARNAFGALVGTTIALPPGSKTPSTDSAVWTRHCANQRATNITPLKSRL